MVGGNFATEQLFGILLKFQEEFSTPNSPQASCRCGDSANDLLRKILFVVRTSMGFPDSPEFEWRPGDTEWAVSVKLLRVLGGACACGDRLFDLWRKILDAVRESFGLPNIAAFAFRFGDSLNILLRKLLLLLQHEIVPVPCECDDMDDWMRLAGPIFCCEDWGAFSGPILECEDWGSV